METKKEVNYLVDWCYNEQGYQDRKNYFLLLRKMLMELEECNLALVEIIFDKYHVHFVDVDDFPRVNIDKPEDKSAA